MLFPKRFFLRASALLAAAMLAPLALIGATNVETGIRDGILHMGNGAEPQDIDSQVVTGVPEHKLLMALSEGLYAEDPRTLAPLPAVAESCDISADAMTYTFHLRATARWSNGEPVTAEDFILSYKRMLTPALAAEYANMLYDFVAGAEDYYRGNTKDFSTVGFKAIDARTLEVRLKQPTPYLLKIIASHYAWNPVPVRVIEKFGGMERRGSAWTRPENFVSNGAFRLKAWKPQQAIIVERSQTYWDREHVRLNEIHFYVTENVPTEERMYRTGQLHVTYELPISKIDAYRKDNPGILRLDPYMSAYFYRINVTRPPFDDVRVRRAFALAVNRETLVSKVTRGGQPPAYNLTPPGFPGYAPKARLQGTLEDARKLLADAGYPGGKGLPPIEVLFNTNDNHRSIAETLQHMWRINLGANVTLKNEEWKVYLDSQDTLNYSLSRSGWSGDYLDPHTFLEIFVTKGGNNDTGWSNAEYDSLRVKALATTDEPARYAIYERMEQILIDELPIIPLYHYTHVCLQHPSVKGYHPTALDNHPWKYVWLEGAP